MPYLTAIFLFIVGVWGKQLVKWFWRIVYDIPLGILQGISSRLGLKILENLDKRNAEDTFLYRLVQGFNFLDLFCIFFFICFCLDPNSFVEVAEEFGGLIVIGFIAPFFLSLYIHAEAPQRIYEKKIKEDKFAQYQYIVGREIEVLNGAIWSERDNLNNITSRGMPIKPLSMEQINSHHYTVGALGYYNGEVEAKLSSRYYNEAYDGYWIPVKYLKCVDDKFSIPQQSSPTSNTDHSDHNTPDTLSQ